MAKTRYANHVEIIIGGYENLAMPDQLDEVVVLRYYVDGPVEREGLVDDVESLFSESHQAFVLDDKWSHFSWGADAATIEIIIGVSTAIASLTGVAGLVEKILQRRTKRKGKPEETLSADDAAQKARRALAKLKEVHESEVSFWMLSQRLVAFVQNSV